MTPVYAWSMLDVQLEKTGLKIYFVLTGCYFAIGTQWPEDDVNWLTKRFDSAEEASAHAINHTALLEKGGDTMQHGPVVVLVTDPTDALDLYVGTDAPSAMLNYLFDKAMLNGTVA